MNHAAQRRSRALAAVGALVLAGSLAACGGDGNGGDGGDAEATATTEEFCSAFADVFSGMTTGGDEQEQIAQVKAAVEDLEEVGTPEDIPEDARRGFDVFVDLIGELDEDMSPEDLQSFGDDISEEQTAEAEAFTQWTTEECPDAFGGLMEGTPGDSESGPAPSE